MPRLYLYPFRYRDDRTGKWVRARYVAERREIAARHSEWEILGPPEIRDVDTCARYFTPYRLVDHAELRRLQERAPQMNPHLERPPAIDVREAFLLQTFLRRYVTYCARRRRYAAMSGAAALFRDVSAAFEFGRSSSKADG